MLPCVVAEGRARVEVGHASLCGVVCCRSQTRILARTTHGWLPRTKIHTLRACVVRRRFTEALTPAHVQALVVFMRDTPPAAVTATVEAALDTIAARALHSVCVCVCVRRLFVCRWW